MNADPELRTEQVGLTLDPHSGIEVKLRSLRSHKPGKQTSRGCLSNV